MWVTVAGCRALFCVNELRLCWIMNEVVPIFCRLVCSRPTESSSELSIDPSGIGLYSPMHWACKIVKKEKGTVAECGGGWETEGGTVGLKANTDWSAFYLLATIDRERADCCGTGGQLQLFDVTCGCIDAHRLVDVHASCILYKQTLY